MTRSAFRLPRRRWPLALMVVAVLCAGGYAYVSRGGPAQAGYRTAQVDRGPVRVAISATGALRALSTVDIGSQVSGRVLEVSADFNDRVARDQVLARLDPANFEARLTQARADLAAARAQLAEAHAALRNAEADYARKQELGTRQLVSRSELDLAEAARDQARARVGSAEAAVQQREAGVLNARLDLEHTVIRSPVDGVVLLRAVEPGQTVAASLQSPVLFQIAEDLSKMRIELSIDESDVGQIHEGQPVRFTVDAFSGRDFRGTVKQVRLAATNTQNVITYPVVVAVDNGDGTLLPGMTANAEIEVSRREDVLRLPNAALRYRPAEAAEPARGGMGGAGGPLAELPRLADSLGLDADQRAVFDRVLAGMRERIQARRAGPPAGGGMGGGPGGGVMVMAAPGGGGAPSPEALRARFAAMMKEQFAEFRGTLDAATAARFDEEFAALFAGRRVTVWALREGKPEGVSVRAGLSDGNYTEVAGEGLGEGEAVITGLERPQA